MIKFFKTRKKESSVESIQYCGFELFYSKGTSLIDRIVSTGHYEPETISCLLQDLEKKKKEELLMLDIGANIGLISLSVVSKFPKVKIYGFEPGSHQYDLFRKTIQHNKLNDSISLYDFALSDKIGEANFFIHETKDASGDGLRDTGRSGKTKRKTVQTMTLDQWWEDNNRPFVDLIKSDTEGAELLVLKGGEKLIRATKPTLILEIFEGNVANYPFEIQDILDFIEFMDYELYTMSGKLMTDDNQTQLLNEMAEFKGLPKK